MSSEFHNQQDFDQSSKPYWIESTSKTAYPVLDEDISTEVAIIGGGMVGITTAAMLKEAGVNVVLIEANRILEGATGHTTAKITAQHGLFYAKLIRQFGKEKARQYAEANVAAIEKIAEIVRERNIDCDFIRKPSYVYTQQDKYIQKIEEEVEAAKILGIEAFYKANIDLPLSAKAAIGFDRQAQFHPRKYLLNLANSIPDPTHFIFEKTRMINLKGKNPYEVITHKGTIRAKKIILASHFPAYDGYGFYFARIHTERSYIIGVRAKEKFPEGMYISAETPTRSFRSQPTQEGELILLGGESHKTGQGKNEFNHYKVLETYAKELYQVQDIPYHWSTQDCITVDHVPYIGLLSPRTPEIYVATGFKKWGMTSSTAAAMILTDMIQGKENSWSSVFNPSRFESDAAIKDFIVQNMDVAQEYIGGKLYFPTKEAEDLKLGEGRIVQLEDRKVGAYKSDDGKIYVVHPTCTHMGCQLSWNEAEKTWDCPCHGSRFTYKGEIIEGPAVKQLESIVVS